jgi:hypothetical protein
MYLIKAKFLTRIGSYILFCYLKKGCYSTFSCFDDQQLLTEIIVIQGLHLGLICDLFGTKNKIEIITRILIKCIVEHWYKMWYVIKLG